MDGSAFDQPEGDAPWIAAETARTRAEEQRVGPRFDAWALFDQDKMAAFVRDDPASPISPTLLMSTCTHTLSCYDSVLCLSSNLFQSSQPTEDSTR